MDYREVLRIREANPKGLAEIEFYRPVARIVKYPNYVWEKPTTIEVTKAVVSLIEMSPTSLAIKLQKPSYIETARNFMHVDYANIKSFRILLGA